MDKINLNREIFDLGCHIFSQFAYSMVSYEIDVTFNRIKAGLIFTHRLFFSNFESIFVRSYFPMKVLILIRSYLYKLRNEISFEMRI